MSNPNPQLPATCPTCGGSTISPYGEAATRGSCPTCHGTGKVPAGLIGDFGLDHKAAEAPGIPVKGEDLPEATLAKRLLKYNWENDRAYQLAVIVVRSESQRAVESFAEGLKERASLKGVKSLIEPAINAAMEENRNAK